ncbi:rCG41695 [Rattus norvegicus]|uniref:RCG41695 n=1 Tax=Rattus norvegicus TaxID=10116 RepID=A6KRI5_RAT|nr:rCG41695 [Rattus norvegicus]
MCRRGEKDPRGWWAPQEPGCTGRDQAMVGTDVSILGLGSS